MLKYWIMCQIFLYHRLSLSEAGMATGPYQQAVYSPTKLVPGLKPWFHFFPSDFRGPYICCQVDYNLRKGRILGHQTFSDIITNLSYRASS